LIDYNYRENIYLEDIKKYIDGTYGEHYVADDIQVVDIWQSLGSLESTARDTAIKYLCRYGKKDGKNKKDLLKAIHYIILMLYASSEDKSEIRDEDITISLSSSRFAGPGEPGELYDHYISDLNGTIVSADLTDSYERTDKYDSRVGQ
jgi:hypothetical protein